MDMVAFSYPLLTVLGREVLEGRRILEIGGRNWGYQLFFSEDNYMNVALSSVQENDRQLGADVQEDETWIKVAQRLEGAPELVFAQTVFEVDYPYLGGLPLAFLKAAENLQPGGIFVIHNTFSSKTAFEGLTHSARMVDLATWRKEKYVFSDFGGERSFEVYLLRKPENEILARKALS